MKSERGNERDRKMKGQRERERERKKMEETRVVNDKA